MAEFLEISLSSFTRQYTQPTDFGFRSLRFENGACIFLKDNLCVVHEVKPTQCRTWPFWEENLESKATWQSEVVDFCPGASEGNSIDDELILRQVRETESALEEEL